MEKRSSNMGLVIILTVLLLLSIGIHLATLFPGEDSPRGFRLPEGNPEAGLVAFLELRCTECHAVYGLELPAAPAPHEKPLVVLGGLVPRPRTVGQMVTSIINPQASINLVVDESYLDADGYSCMPDFRNTMTTGQLFDLVTMLHGRYEVMPPEITPIYGPIH